MTSFIQTFCVVIFTLWEVLSRISILGHVVRIHFAAIFFMYIIFRVRSWMIIFLVFVHTVVVNPFTAYSFIQLLVSYIVVVGIVWRIREQIYTETYLTMACWVFGLVFLHQLILDFAFVRPETLVSQLRGLGPLIINCALSAAVALPVFIFLDRIFDALMGRRWADRPASRL